MNHQLLHQAIGYGLPLPAILPSLFNHPLRVSISSGIFMAVLLGIALAGFYELDKMTAGEDPAFVGQFLFLWCMLILYASML